MYREHALWVDTPVHPTYGEWIGMRYARFRVAHALGAW